MTIVSQAPVIEMDGRRLYYTFIAGARKVIEHQVELNKINVFPVNDGDTGTNLASTIRAVVDSLHPHRSYKITADRIAETTLVNARGNSGIIFAQFLYGMSTETGNFKTITINQFAESIKNSDTLSKLIYCNSFKIAGFGTHSIKELCKNNSGISTGINECGFGNPVSCNLI